MFHFHNVKITYADCGLRVLEGERGLLHDEGLDCTLIERLVRGVVQRKGLTP